MSFEAPQAQALQAQPKLETEVKAVGERVGKRPKPKNQAQTFLGEAGQTPGPSSGAQLGTTMLGSAA